MASSSVSGVGKRLLALVIMMAVLSSTSRGVSGRAMKAPELHPIDICIFSCDMCFKGETLVGCANDCITSDGQMDNSWGRVCRMFDGRRIHNLLNNMTP